MARILVLALTIAIFYYAYKTFGRLMVKDICKECNGLGYWLGTRGDKNPCGHCGGTGKIK